MLSTTLCSIRLKNPLILASGILGISEYTMEEVVKRGCGAVTTKSTSLVAREGHNNPTVIALDNNVGIINAVGLPNPGIDNIADEIEYLKKKKVPAIASIFAYKLDEFGILISKLNKANPDMIEVNISCPNVEDEFGKPFCADPALAAEVTALVKKQTDIPVSMKLSPNVPNIAAVAKACEEAGADAITAINTMPGMLINIDARRPVLANKAGGLSGPMVKPIAVKAVYDIYEAVKIPIIGTGGINSGKDALEIIMAGAAALGVGSAVYYHGLDAFRKITSEMESWMKENKVKSLDDIRGCAHQ